MFLKSLQTKTSYLNINFNQLLNFVSIVYESKILLFIKTLSLKHFGKNPFGFGVGLSHELCMSMGLLSVTHSLR
jgi:hypothetical protein